jgi:hypothetical protein
MAIGRTTPPMTKPKFWNFWIWPYGVAEPPPCLSWGGQIQKFGFGPIAIQYRWLQRMGQQFPQVEGTLGFLQRDVKDQS